MRKEQPSPQVAEGLLESIVLVMPDHARMVLVKKLIEEEVKLTGLIVLPLYSQLPETEATLFRSNALATKAMTKIAKQVGQEYIEALLIDFVKELCKKNEDMEVFPSSVAEGNLVFINLISQEFLSRRMQTMSRKRLLSSSIGWKAPSHLYLGKYG